MVSGFMGSTTRIHHIKVLSTRSYTSKVQKHVPDLLRVKHSTGLGPVNHCPIAVNFYTIMLNIPLAQWH